MSTRLSTLLIAITILLSSCNTEPKCTGSKSFPFQFKGLRDNALVKEGENISFELVKRYSCVDSIYLSLGGNRVLASEGKQSLAADLAPGTYKLIGTGITPDGNVEKKLNVIVIPKDGTKMVSIEEWETKPHGLDHYTQGLEFYQGKLYESTGQPRESRLGPLSSSYSSFENEVLLPGEQFGEGMTILNDEIYQTTWLDGICYVRDLNTLEEKRRFNYSGQGWGLANDGENLYFSDGSSYIYMKDPENFSNLKTLKVYDNKGFVQKLNELEFINGKLWANIYLTNRIAVINPSTGFVEAYLDASKLTDNERKLNPALKANDEVLNGIAFNAEEKLLYLTGKNWQHIYMIPLSQLAFK